jgi:hypothetical protein
MNKTVSSRIFPVRGPPPPVEITTITISMAMLA